MSTRYIEPVNPATGEKLPKIPIASAQEVEAIVQKARAAWQDSWRFLSYEERGKILIKAADELSAKSEDIARLITTEMGRVLTESRNEVNKNAGFLKYFAEDVGKKLAPKEIDISKFSAPEKKAKVIYEPIGVAAIIKPWNAPIQTAVWAVGPALMAGCAVILKPSEYTPHSSMELQHAFDRAGMPPGVFTVLIGDGETGAQLVNSNVDVVSFTGSLPSGRKVAEAASRRVRKMVLELSGKDGLIICDDVSNLDFAASAIVYGAFFNCGQLCSSLERVYVSKKIAPQLIEKVVALVKSLKVGNGLTPGMDIGPLANQRQFDIVAGHVEEAKKMGAKVLTGGYKITDGELAKGLFYAPTVLTNVNHDMRIMRDIVFGPVVSFMTYDTLEEAIQLVNDTNYGLGTAVLTQNKEMEDWLVRRLDSGMVWINEPLLSVAPCTWSVIKDSGYGGELGESGYKEYTFEKVVFTQYENNDKPRGWYLPYQK